jgi:hypothetical protein
MPPKNTGTLKKSNAPPRRANPNAIEVEESKDSKSQTLAKLAAGSVLSAFTLKTYSGCGDALEVPDLITEMKRAGDEAVSGDLSRIERMLTNQALTLDAIFNNLGERSYRQDTFKGIEVLMRLALKAQAQARSTAEALALMKNPMPYIKQTNIAHGHQQVNNDQKEVNTSKQATGTGNSQSEPNKLLEADHGQRMDLGAQKEASRTNQTLGAVV